MPTPRSFAGRALLGVAAAALLAAACRGGPPDGFESGLRELLNLAVLEVPVDKVVFARAEQRFFSLTIGTATHVAESRAVVKLGIRADDLAPGDVTVSGESVVVRLPPVEVLDLVYQPETFVVRPDLSRRSFLRSISLAERERIYREAEADLRASLPYDTMLERARARVRVLVRAYLGRFYRDVRVEFRAAG